VCGEPVDFAPMAAASFEQGQIALLKGTKCKGDANGRGLGI